MADGGGQDAAAGKRWDLWVSCVPAALASPPLLSVSGPAIPTHPLTRYHSHAQLQSPICRVPGGTAGSEVVGGGAPPSDPLPTTHSLPLTPAATSTPSTYPSSRSLAWVTGVHLARTEALTTKP